MPDLATLEKIRDRVRAATEPDRGLDIVIDLVISGAVDGWEDFDVDHNIKSSNKRIQQGENIGYTPWSECLHYSIFLDSVVTLVNRTLPGWWWRVGTCHLSDDATIGPDHNDPAHSERLHREFPPDYVNAAGERPFDGGIDVDRRPAGNVALALCEALLTALIEVDRYKAAIK